MSGKPEVEVLAGVEDGMAPAENAVEPRKPTPKGKKKRRKKSYPINLNLSNCKYEILRIVCKKLGWKEVGDEDAWQVYWTDTSVSIDRVMRLSKSQKINHFTGMLEICRKNRLARNLNRMSEMFPDDFKFYPKSYILPQMKDELLSQFGKKKKTFILKPDAGCQGKGIYLAQTASQVNKSLKELEIENVVAQRYLNKPYLIDGYKFDMRIYVLVVSCDPLRVFMYNEGLVRFCTERYEPPRADNLDIGFMHLTNYALNKKNENFKFNEDAEDMDDGSKWSLEGLREHMEDEGHDFDAIMDRICQLTVKTIISIQPLLAHNYWSVLKEENNDGYSCFEILGLDVMIDEKLRPWLIEVNHSPSFTVDTPLDMSIKEALIMDTIDLVRIDPRQIKRAKAEERKGFESRLYSSHRDPAMRPERVRKTREEILEMREKALRARERYEEDHLGGYFRIFPSEDPDTQATYDRLMEGSQALFNKTFASRIKDTLQAVKETALRKRAEDEEERHRQATGLRRAVRRVAKDVRAKKEGGAPGGAAGGSDGLSRGGSARGEGGAEPRSSLHGAAMAMGMDALREVAGEGGGDMGGGMMMGSPYPSPIPSPSPGGGGSGAPRSPKTPLEMQDAAADGRAREREQVAAQVSSLLGRGGGGAGRGGSHLLSPMTFPGAEKVPPGPGALHRGSPQGYGVAPAPLPLPGVLHPLVDGGGGGGGLRNGGVKRQPQQPGGYNVAEGVGGGARRQSGDHTAAAGGGSSYMRAGDRATSGVGGTGRPLSSLRRERPSSGGEPPLQQQQQQQQQHQARPVGAPYRSSSSGHLSTYNRGGGGGGGGPGAQEALDSAVRTRALAENVTSLINAMTGGAGIAGGHPVPPMGLGRPDSASGSRRTPPRGGKGVLEGMGGASRPPVGLPSAPLVGMERGDPGGVAAGFAGLSFVDGGGLAVQGMQISSSSGISPRGLTGIRGMGMRFGGVEGGGR